jgi:ketosteroid isomerase-like protein
MSQENVEIVRGIYEAVARRDPVAAFEVYSESIVWDVSNSRRVTVMSNSVFHGYEGVREFWREGLSVFGEIDLDVEELIDADNRVVAVITEREVGRSSGAPVSATHAAVWTLTDSKVVRMQIFDDRAEALKAVGLEE